MNRLIDWLEIQAERFLYWAGHRRLTRMEDRLQPRFKSLEMAGDGSFSADIIMPGMAGLLEEAIVMLEAGNSGNYLVFDMISARSRSLRPVRVTIEYIDGIGPAEKAERLRHALENLADKFDVDADEWLRMAGL